MSKQRPPPLTLVVGGEELLAERAIAQIVARARAAEPETEQRVVDATVSGAAGAIVEACSPTLFGGGSVVVVENAESADDSCSAAIAVAAADPAPDVAIVVVHAGGAKGKKVLDKLGPLASERIDCAEVKKGRGISDFVAAEIRHHKKSMSPEAQALLVAAVGSDVRGLAAACLQLAADVESREIDADSVRMYFGGTVDVTGFQIADAVINKQAAQALRLLRLAAGNDSARLGPATVSALANSVRQVVALASAPAGMSDRDLAALTRVPAWKLKTLAAQARRWRPMDIARAVLLLSDLDASVKGGLREGEQLDPAQKGLALESAVYRLGTKNPSR